jgi:hypothetical protein
MNETLRALLLAWLALFGPVALAGPAAAPGKPQRLTSPDQVPAGLAKSDWQGIRAAYEAARHEFQPSPLTTDPIAQQAYLKASNPRTNDWFGFSVAVSGDTVVVGAHQEDSNATGVNAPLTGGTGTQSDNSARSAGAAYVFVRNGTGWTQQAYLKASNTGEDDDFGISVAVSGDTVVVGAYREDSNATGINGNGADNSAGDAGAAYVFVRSGTTWTQQAYLKASNTGTNDWFGLSVAVSGDTVVVGAYLEASNATGVNGNEADNSAFGAGAAYVFVRNGTGWTQQAYLKPSNTGNDRFGRSVAVSNDTVVVGATGEASNATGVNGNETDNSAGSSGAAYVFVRSGTGWSQQAYLKASNTGAVDGFGESVAVSGDTVVVGASDEASNATGVNAPLTGGTGTQADNSARSAGAAYVFVRSGATWSQQAYLKASNTGAFEQFGMSVAVSGDTVVVGSIGEASNATGVNGNETDNSAFGAGAAYVFVRNGTGWTQQAYLKASNTGTRDIFGLSVAVSGDTVVVGGAGEASNATGVDGNGADNSASYAGAAYIFTGVGPVTPPLAGLTLRLAPGAGGERRFIATGSPGGAHRLQAAATIAGPWTDVPGAGAAGTAAANGELLLEDATPPSDTVFYRAMGP